MEKSKCKSSNFFEEIACFLRSTFTDADSVTTRLRDQLAAAKDAIDGIIALQHEAKYFDAEIKKA